MRVAALTQGWNVPSSRYRIRQCLPMLSRLGVEATEYCPRIDQYVQLPGRLASARRRYLLPVAAAQIVLNLFTRLPGTLHSRHADLVWISRSYLPGMNRLVRLTGRPRVLDVDDAVWLSEPLGAAQAVRMARRMETVIVGNRFLADWYEPHCRNLTVIPTSVDCEVYRPLPANGADTSFTVGWIGTAVNFLHLKDVFGAVQRFLADHRDARFMLISNRRPEWWPGDDARLVFHRWSAETEVADLNRLDVGLMPLQDSEWARGKCAYKMLQYMSTARPVLVSPVGVNQEVLDLGECGMACRTESDWYEALAELYGDHSRCSRMGAAGRVVVNEHFSTTRVAAQYAEVFRSTLA